MDHAREGCAARYPVAALHLGRLLRRVERGCHQLSVAMYISSTPAPEDGCPPRVDVAGLECPRRGAVSRATSSTIAEAGDGIHLQAAERSGSQQALEAGRRQCLQHRLGHATLPLCCGRVFPDRSAQFAGRVRAVVRVATMFRRRSRPHRRVGVWVAVIIRLHPRCGSTGAGGAGHRRPLTIRDQDRRCAGQFRRRSSWSPRRSSRGSRRQVGTLDARCSVCAEHATRVRAERADRRHRARDRRRPRS